MLKKSSLNFTTLFVTCLLELGLNTSFPAIAKSQTDSLLPTKLSRTEAVGAGLKLLKFRLPSLRAPRNIDPAAVRGNSSCIPKDKSMMALLPTTNIGVTQEANPTLFVYVPKTEAKIAELTLQQEGKDNVIYKKTFTISNTPGVVSLSLPNDGNKPPLEINKQYHWKFQLVCDAINPEGTDPAVDGGIKRVWQSSTMENKLRTVQKRDRPSVYAAAGYWNDTLKSLAGLLKDKPNDQQLAADWADLLSSQGLEEIAHAPLISCCSAQYNSEASTGQ